jgi:F-type H+-transporting ATPase subunit b
MELDWTTFALEIINFLALIWILKRFLYRPVLATLGQRRAGIEANLKRSTRDGSTGPGPAAPV